MKLSTRCFKGSLLVICGALHWAAAEQEPPEISATSPFPPTIPPPFFSSSLNLTEVGSLCEDGEGISLPSDGSPAIITGRHSKLYSFADCSYSYYGPVPATVYQIEGTGAVFDVSMFSGPYGNENQVSVFEGCPAEESNGAGNADDDNNGDEIYSDTMHTCVSSQYYQGARWQTEPGQLYTIVVFSYGGYSTDFILRVGTIEANPICGPEGESAISTIDLGTIDTASGSLAVLGGPEEGVFVTDLPQCDYQVQSSSVLYQVTVSQPNVLVSVYAEGGDSYVTVYKGDCDSGYSCLAPMPGGYGYPMPMPRPIDDIGSQSPTEDQELNNELEEIPADLPEPGSRQVELSMPRYNYNVHSFHNENAGTTYLVSINSCCSVDVSDFRLTVNATSYGDVCDDSVAVDVSSGEVSVTVNLPNEKVYRDLNTCYGRPGYYEYDQSTFPPGDEYYIGPAGPISGRTAFYTITGDGNSYVAYVAPSDPYRYYGQLRMALFTSSSCDEKPQCLQGDNYNGFLSFQTVEGETYYLAVYNEHGDIQESFDLKINSISSNTPCQDAVDLGIVGSAGRTVEGTTAGAGFYKAVNICNVYAEITRPRVFSFVAEEDGPMMASVKVDKNLNGISATNFYPQISVVTSCDNGDCMTGLTTYEIDMSPSAVWKAQAGLTYYVVVYSYDLFNTGDFELVLENVATTDICQREDVIELGTVPEEGATYEGSTVSAPLVSVPDECQDQQSGYQYLAAVSRAAAFSLKGDGGAYFLSVSNAYSFSPQVSVYKGSCDALECVSSRNFYTNSFLVDTKANETYTILVGDCCNAIGVGGSFKLHARKVVAGNVTANATETIEPFTEATKRMLGSTSAGLFYPGLPACYNPIDSPASVYKLDTGVGLFTARVSGFGFEAQVSLLKEDGSGGFECYGRQDYRQVSWNGAEEQALYLVVYGCCDANAVGDFALRIRQSSTTNDPCDDVLDLGNVTEDGLMHVGSLQGAAFLSSEAGSGTVCEYEGHYPYTEGRTKIFTVVGNGKSLVASTFISQSTMNRGIGVSVTVAKGTCGSFECIEGARSDAFSSSSLTWASTAGETYHIVVSSCCSFESDDEFVLMVYEEGTKSFGYGFPVYPFDKDHGGELGDGESTGGFGNETNRFLEDYSSSKLVDRTSLFAAIAIMAALL